MKSILTMIGLIFSFGLNVKAEGSKIDICVVKNRTYTISKSSGTASINDDPNINCKQDGYLTPSIVPFATIANSLVSDNCGAGYTCTYDPKTGNTYVKDSAGNVVIIVVGANRDIIGDSKPPVWTADPTLPGVITIPIPGLRDGCNTHSLVATGISAASDSDCPPGGGGPGSKTTLDKVKNWINGLVKREPEKTSLYLPPTTYEDELCTLHGLSGDAFSRCREIVKEVLQRKGDSTRAGFGKFITTALNKAKNTLGIDPGSTQLREFVKNTLIEFGVRGGKLTFPELNALQQPFANGLVQSIDKLAADFASTTLEITRNNDGTPYIVFSSSGTPINISTEILSKANDQLTKLGLPPIAASTTITLGYFVSKSANVPAFFNALREGNLQKALDLLTKDQGNATVSLFFTYQGPLPHPMGGASYAHQGGVLTIKDGKINCHLGGYGYK